MIDEIKHLQNLFNTNTRNFQILQKRKDMQGLDTPVYVFTQLEDLAAELKRLQAELKKHGIEMDLPYGVEESEPQATTTAPTSADQQMSSSTNLTTTTSQSPAQGETTSSQEQAYYTYRIRVANESSVQVEKRGPDNEVMGEPNGVFSYTPAAQAELEALLQAAQVGVLNEADQTRKLGEALFKVLFDPVLRQDFVNFYNDVVHTEDELLRIELDIDERRLPNIAALPWEFMSVPLEANLGTIWLGTAPDLIFSRRRSQWHAAQPIQLEANEKLRIALAVAAPPNLGPVEYEEVYADLQALADDEANQIELLPLVNKADPEKIDDLLAKKPHIFHFIGHGKFNEANHTGQIALVDDLGKMVLIDEYYFSDLFNQHRPGAVLLQACEGAASSASQAFVGIASRVVQQNIPVVVAMQYEVSNSTASRFARRFYRQLAEGDPVDRAAQVGRRTIALNPATGYKSRDFATPVLFMRVRDGHLFQRRA